MVTKATITPCKALVAYTTAEHARPCRHRAVLDGWCHIHHPTVVAARKELRRARIKKFLEEY